MAQTRYRVVHAPANSPHFPYRIEYRWWWWPAWLHEGSYYTKEQAIIQKANLIRGPQVVG